MRKLEARATIKTTAPELQLHGEMVRGNDHSLRQIKAVRRKSLNPGIELKIEATGCARLRHQPIEKRSAIAERPDRLVRHKVVDIAIAAGEKRFRHSIARDGAHFALVFQESELEAVNALSFDLRDENFLVFESGS